MTTLKLDSLDDTALAFCFALCKMTTEDASSLLGKFAGCFREVLDKRNQTIEAPRAPHVYDFDLQAIDSNDVDLTVFVFQRLADVFQKTRNRRAERFCQKLVAEIFTIHEMESVGHA